MKFIEEVAVLCQNVAHPLLPMEKDHQGLSAFLDCLGVEQCWHHKRLVTSVSVSVCMQRGKMWSLQPLQNHGVMFLFMILRKHAALMATATSLPASKQRLTSGVEVGPRSLLGGLHPFQQVQQGSFRLELEASAPWLVRFG